MSARKKAAPQTVDSEDDVLEVGDDVTATFDDSPSNPTERASSENLGVLTEDEDEDVEVDDEDEDDDDDDDEFEDEDEEGEDEEEAEIEEDDEDDGEEEDDDEDEEDHDLATGPKAPSVYRRL